MMCGIFFFGFFLMLFVVFDLIGFEDFDFEVLENGENVIDFFLVFDGFRESFVDVVKGEVFLFF